MRFGAVRVFLGEDRVFRSLRPSDVARLSDFYNGLSDESRSFWHRDPDGHSLAVEHCRAVDRYDKLRMVVDTEDGFAALYELSFAITQGDVERFGKYGMSLSEDVHVRFGACVRDDQKGTGLASRLLAETALVAKHERRTILILWGGAQPDNGRARRFYLREGFEEVGQTGDIIDMIRPA